MQIAIYETFINLFIKAPQTNQNAVLNSFNDIHLSLDDEELVGCAEHLYYSLKNVDKTVLKRGPELSRAIYRYEFIWLPMLHANRNSKVVLVPPPDVMWVWMVHLLAPETYHEDMARLFGPSVTPRRLPLPDVLSQSYTGLDVFGNGKRSKKEWNLVRSGLR